MRPTHLVLGAAMVLGSVAPIAAQDRTPGPTTIVSLLDNDMADRALPTVSRSSSRSSTAAAGSRRRTSESRVSRWPWNAPSADRSVS